MSEYVVVTRKLPGFHTVAAAALPRGSFWMSESDGPLARSELLARASGATGLLVVGDIVDEELFSYARRLRVVVQYGAGVDNVDLTGAQEHRVVVANLPAEVTYSTAELTMTLLLTCARRVVEADRWIRQFNPYLWTPTNLIGSNLHGKTLGLVGFGRIAQAVCKIAHAFGMTTIYSARTRRYDDEKRLGASFANLDDLLSRSDAVSLHVPGSPSTHHLIGAAELAQMSRHSILINTSRGSVVDEAALVSALRSAEIGAVGLDVFEREPLVSPGLLALDRVVLTPHIGTSTWETRADMNASAVRALIHGLAGREVPNRVI